MLTRIQVPNIAIETGVRDPVVPFKVCCCLLVLSEFIADGRDLLKVMAKYRGVEKEAPFVPVFGVNAVIHGSGMYAVGDRARVTSFLDRETIPAPNKAKKMVQ